MDTENLVKSLFQIKSIKIREANPYILNDNSIAPIKIDIRNLISHPQKRQEIVNLFIKKIKLLFNGSYDVIGGVSPVGIPFTYLIANKMNKPMVYVRDKEINSLDGRYSVEGCLNENDKVLLLTNEIRTGKRVIETIKILKKRGAKIIGCLCLIDYNLKGVKEDFEKLDVNIYSLFDLEYAINIGLKNNFISDKQAEIIREWNSDFYGWMHKQKELIKNRINKIKQTAIDIFIDLGLIEFHFDNPLKFKTILSPVIIDTKKLLSYPKEREFIFKSMTDLATPKINFNQINIIAGEASSGIAPAMWVADLFNKPMIYIHEDNYANDIIEGKLESNNNVVLVDDVLGTGQGSIDTIEKIQMLGGKVRNMISIVDYGVMHAKQILDYENVDHFSLIKLSDIIDECYKKEMISDNQKEELYKWIQDPFAWSKKMNLKNN